MKDFKGLYDSKKEEYQILFTIDRDLGENDRILVWFLLTGSKYWNFSIYSSYFDNRQLNLNIDNTRCILNGSMTKSIRADSESFNLNI
jgi:hypothetical protein